MLSIDQVVTDLKQWDSDRTAELAAVNGTLDTANATIETRNQKIAELNQQITDLKQQIVDLQKQVADLQKALDEATQPDPPPVVDPPTPPPTKPTMLGVNWSPQWTSDSGQDKVFAYLDAAKIPTVRIPILWHSLEATKGSISGAYYNRVVNFIAKCQTRGIKVLGIVGGAPAWAGNDGGGADRVHNQAHVPDYASFCASIAKAFYPTMDSMEIWNEPNIAQSWYPSGCLGAYPGSTPTLYINTLKAAYPAIKAVCPNMIVTSGSTFTCQVQDYRASKFLHALYDNGCKDFFDVLNVHNYPQHVTQLYPTLVTPKQPWFNPTTPKASIMGMFTSDVLPIMQAAGDGAKDVWFTELGYNTVAGSGNNSCTAAEQATKITELGAAFAAHTYAPNIKRVYWYNLIDGKASLNNNGEYNWGLINHTDEDYFNYAAAGALAPKPSWASFVPLQKKGS